jgi:hypothetical protein
MQEDLGEEAVRIIARAYVVPVIPHAITGLMSASAALDAPASLMFDRHALPFETAGEMFTAVDELDLAMTGDLDRIDRLHAEISADLDEAVQTLLHPPTGDGTEEDQAAAEREQREALLRKADCENALETLDVLLARINYATGQVKAVPQQFADAYEVPVTYVREYGPLPRRGQFLVPAGQEGTP